MLYTEYITKAKDMCIAIDDVNNVAYLLPDYKYMLILSDLNLEDVTDYPGLTYEDVSENLKLEAEAYNARHNYVPALADWMRELIITTLSPLAVQEQNELIKNVIEYIKADAEKENTQEQAAQKEAEESVSEQTDADDTNSKIIQFTSYMNFAKKDS